MEGSTASKTDLEDITLPKDEIQMQDKKEGQGTNTDLGKVELVWINVIRSILAHFLAMLGLIVLPFASFKTMIFFFVTHLYSSLGITAGAHRLWSHRSYKASFPVRLFLLVANTMANQNGVYVWAHIHRVHHKHSDTDADPHNSKRGLFFSHMGWLLCKEHPEVTRSFKKVDMSDLHKDKLVMFQYNYYLPMALLFYLILPTVIPVYFWNEDPVKAFLLSMLRYKTVYHAAGLVNSLAHYGNDKPYDVNLIPCQRLSVSFIAIGEGFHNFHHAFPYDYSTSEWRYSFNFTTFFIDCMALIGLVSDRRTASDETVKNRMMRTGPDAKKVL